MAYSPRPGKYSRVMVGANAIWAKDAPVTFEGGDLDTVTFENDGFDTGTIGIYAAGSTVRGIWNADDNVFDEPPGIYPRDDLADVNIFLNVTDSTFWDFPFMRVISSNSGTAVRDLVSFDFHVKNQGIFTPPTG
jgi:hypothetical protein